MKMLLMLTFFSVATLFAMADEDDDIEVTAGQVTTQPDEYLLIPLRIDRPEGNLIRFKKTQKAIHSIKDDLGTNLLGRSKVWQLIKKVEVSGNGKYINLEIQVPNFPKEDAKKLTIEGTLTVVCSSGKEIHLVEEVRTILRTKGTIGDIPFEIRSVQPISPDKIVQIFYSDVKRDATPVIGIKYLTGGVPMETKKEWRYTKGGYLVHLRMPAEQRLFDIQMEKWGEFSVVDIPYSFTLSL